MLTGFTCIRNNFALDFCVELTIKSLLPLCDQVVVCDSDSTDGTREMLDEWRAREPKLHIINRRWENPVGKIGWIVEWMQWAQQRCEPGDHLYLDADEVLDPLAYEVLRDVEAWHACFWFRRINYWRDVHHEAPHGTVCAHEVARYGPSCLPMHSDEIHDGVQFPLPEPEMRRKAVRDGRLVIHHYGFLRKRKAFLAKSEGNARAFFGVSQDARLVEAENHPDQHWTEFCPFEKPLLSYSGEQPKIAHDWLKERGAL